MPFQRRWKCIFHWLTILDKVKIPWYSHKRMHRKRVTCELHDSYFRSMTIKTCRSKGVGVELLYNWVHRKFNQFWRQDVVEKASTQQKGPLGPPIEFWRPDQLVTRCGRESQHPAESWAPGPPVEQPRRTGKKCWWPWLEEVKMLQFCSVSNSLSHTTLSNKVRGIFF